MASFQKRGKSWQYTVSRMVNGKSNPIRKSGFRTKKEAQVAAAEVEAELQRGVAPYLNREPFSEYFYSWLKLYKPDISDVTFMRYEDTFETIERYFFSKPIQDITRRDYQAFLNDYALTRAKETTRKLNIHIRACVRDALDEGIIRIDFTRGAIITGNTEPKRPEEKHLSYDDARRLLNELYNRLDRSLGYYLLLLGLTTGMRFGELIGLTRKDFDFDTNNITVNKTWDYKTGTGFSNTKTDTSNRVVKVDIKTMDTFKSLFEATPENPKNLVFFSPHNDRMVLTNALVNKLLKNTLEYLDIEPVITSHGLRHTHASVLLYQRVSIYYVSERLGHATIETTLKHYAHVIKELREEDTKNTTKTFEEMKS